MVKHDACDMVRAGVWDMGVLAQQSKPHTWLRALLSCELTVLGQAIYRLASKHHFYERGLLHPFIDYDKPKEFQNRIDDEMDEDGYVHGRDDAGIGQDLNMDYIEENLIDA